MKYKEVALTVAVLMTSGTLVAAKDSHLEWISRDGRMYWLENGEIQGVTGDPKNIIDEIYGIERGREIYDPESDAWYWLDACYDGAKAVSKEV